MNNWHKYKPLLPALLLYGILWISLRPWLGYMLDSDAVAYLTMAEKAAQGDFWRSVNGLWSPLNSWLLAPFIQHGFHAWETAKVFNAVIGGILLILSYILSLRFIQQTKLRVCFSLCLAVMLDYFVYFQVFADLLQLIFILLYLLLLWQKDLIQKKYKVVLAALFMGIGFYAKAYTSLFFLLHFSFTMFWKYKNQGKDRKAYLRTWALGIFVFLICLAPWSWAIHKKYHVWSMNGLAGKMNMSWYINSGKSFKDSIHLLIPPAYTHSPSFWEDPYLSQAALSSPLSSAHHFIRWSARVVLTCFQAITCMNEISALAIAIFIFILYFYFIKEKEKHDIQLLWLSCLILPLGYLAMHIETRYLWLSAILLLIAGFYLIEQHLHIRKLRFIAMCLLCLSFIYFPVLQFESLRYKNKDLFDKADWLKKNGMKGSFTSNITDSGQMWVIAYLTGNSFYTIEQTGYSFNELNTELGKYKVDYFIQESENNMEKNVIQEKGWELVASGYDFQVYHLKHASSTNP